MRRWTSLLDPQKYPAPEWPARYGQRWESEVAYQELKGDLRGGDRLPSPTPLTAAQEIAARLPAPALRAPVRWEAADKGPGPPLRIRFLAMRRWGRPLWPFLERGAALLSPEQIATLIERPRGQIAASVVPARRKCSCPRALRQPVKGWPRLLKNTYGPGATQDRLTPAKP